MNLQILELITKIVGLIAAIIGLIAGVISLKIALDTRRKLTSVDKRLESNQSSTSALEQRLERESQKFNSFDIRLQKILSGDIPKCIAGPTHTYGSPGHVDLRIKLTSMDSWWFVAVSQNRPDSVWVQRMDRPDPEGRLHLEAYKFKGRYAVYGTCDDATITRFQELQAQAARGQAATIHDLPRGAFLICVSDA
jgi:hypothetical protein